MNNCKALLLSSTHKIWTGNWIYGSSLKDITQQLTAKGLKVSSPIGTRPPYFVLMNLDFDSELEDHLWFPLNSVLSENSELSDEIFSVYSELLLGGYLPPVRNFDVFAFGSSPFMAAQLAHLVAKGVKRCCASWKHSQNYDAFRPALLGPHSVVTDDFGIPVCFIQTEKVEIIPFSSVTAHIASTEGEGDLSLDFWKDGHRQYFKKGGEQVGVEFKEDDLIYVETFRLVQVFGKSP